MPGADTRSNLAAVLQRTLLTLFFLARFFIRLFLRSGFIAAMQERVSTRDTFERVKPRHDAGGVRRGLVKVRRLGLSAIFVGVYGSLLVELGSRRR
ncbi:hypothetical protein B0H19DRAFT_1124702 [Mycena capillaripes]|nr:hypothetical protein B0H19DRAFT_1124702 [Mycena capillaripes]